MKADERLQDIIKRLNKFGTVSVKELAIDYRVTEDLVRKDLKKLEAQGLLDRVYGGAERKRNKFAVSSIHFRMSDHAADKQAIASIAVSLIKNGEFVFLDASSTSAHIAMALATSGKEVTVLTNMFDVMQLLCGVEGINVIAIGGEFDLYSGSFTGQETVRQIMQYSVDKAFVSCRSVSVDEGVLIEGFVNIGSEKRAILDIARERIVATQVVKYRSSGVYRFYKLKDIHRLIVDRPLEGDVVQKLDLLGIALLTAQ